MTRAELRTLAFQGVLLEIRDMEERLELYYRAWPQAFLSKTAPQLLRPDLKAAPTNGTGHHWPALRVKRKYTRRTPAAVPARPARKKRIFTAAWRKQQANRMRALHASGAIRRAKAKAARAR